MEGVFLKTKQVWEGKLQEDQVEEHPMRLLKGRANHEKNAKTARTWRDLQERRGDRNRLKTTKIDKKQQASRLNLSNEERFMITIHQIDNFRYIDELRPKPTRELLRQSVEQFVATDRPKTASAEDLTDELSDICEDAIFEERQREANMEMVLQQLKSTFERRQCDILIRPKSYTEADDYVPLGCAKLMGLGDGQHGEETLYCAVSVQPCKKAGPLKSAWMALNGAFSWAFNRTY